MNLETPPVIRLEGAGSSGVVVPADTEFAVPDPAKTREVPEASTWALLILAAAVWLLRLRGRQKRRSRGY